MVKFLLPSVYVVEPLGEACSGWGSHWNYKWGGRSGNFNSSFRYRKERDGLFMVKDKDGKVWLMDEESLNHQAEML
jgi:hypothetical protein